MSLLKENLIQILFVLFLASSCSPAKKTEAPPPVVKKRVIVAAPTPVAITKTADDIFFENVYKNDPNSFSKIFKSKKEWNVQIIYTEIKRGPGSKVELTDHYFNKGGSGYFYPASTVKLPLAILALQKLNEYKNKGISKNTTMLTGISFSGQTEVYNDPNTPEGKPSIEQYIKRAMLVNENDACNRLYEFLGQEYINTELKKHGYNDAEIIHRMGVNFTEEENRHTNPVSFYDSTGRLLYTQPGQYSLQKYPNRKDSIGKSYLSAGKIINRPLTMNDKNRISLQNLHAMVSSLFFPGSVRGAESFNITEADRLFLINLMGAEPGESVYPSYNANNYNGYTKYIYFGGEKYTGKNFRSYNTSGTAYGQMTDGALIKDLSKNTEFLVSATIYCNSDGVVNDDKYDYTTTGLPFFKSLGKSIYDYEIKKK